jgi:hypothetical protein
MTVDVKAYYDHIPTDRRKRIRNAYLHAFQSCISAVLVYCEVYGVTDKIGALCPAGPSYSPSLTDGVIVATELAAIVF